MINKPKIIFFDIDGTLIDMQKKQISQRMLETLRALQKNGIRICIATGRPPLTLPHFEGVEFDAFLTFNGAYCYNQQEEIFSNPIAADDVKRLIENAAAMQRPVCIATIDRLAANGRDRDLEDYFAVAKQTVEVSRDFDQVAKKKVYQLMLGCIGKERERLLEGVHNAKIAAWWDRAVDVIPADGGKGVGVEQVLQYYHLTSVDAMAFGDGDNDREMLETVGMGVAMANASQSLKNIADAVCGDVAEDGIYQFCLEQGLIQESCCCEGMNGTLLESESRPFERQINKSLGNEE